MSTEELTMQHVSTVYSSREHTEKRAEKISARETRAYALRCTLSSLVAAAGVGSMGFGFWLLAERQKDLGFIDVLIAFAVIAGVAVAACGVTALVRAIRERRSADRF